jgi:hypothetical protein
LPKLINDWIGEFADDYFVFLGAQTTIIEGSRVVLSASPIVASHSCFALPPWPQGTPGTFLDVLCGTIARSIRTAHQRAYAQRLLTLIVTYAQGAFAAVELYSDVTPVVHEIEGTGGGVGAARGRLPARGVQALSYLIGRAGCGMAAHRVAIGATHHGCDELTFISFFSGYTPWRLLPQ